MHWSISSSTSLSLVASVGTAIGSGGASVGRCNVSPGFIRRGDDLAPLRRLAFRGRMRALRATCRPFDRPDLMAFPITAFLVRYILNLSFSAAAILEADKPSAHSRFSSSICASGQTSALTVMVPFSPASIGPGIPARQQAGAPAVDPADPYGLPSPAIGDESMRAPKKHGRLTAMKIARDMIEAMRESADHFRDQATALDRKAAELEAAVTLGIIKDNESVELGDAVADVAKVAE